MLQNLGKRVLLAIGGLSVLALGIVLVMGFLQIEATIPKLGGYVFLVPLFGLGMVWAAFARSPVADPVGRPEAAPPLTPPPLPPNARGPNGPGDVAGPRARGGSN